MSGPAPSSITVDQLVALSDEMAALVRAGVPLDRGLVAAGLDLRGRVGHLTGRLGGRLEQGDAVAAALEADGAGVPAFYRAVVEAGLRSGRLAKALEGLAAYGRGFAETRRAIGLALIYPMMVVGLAYGLFLLFVLRVAPRLADTFVTFRLGPLRTLELFSWLRVHLIYWAPILPAAMVMLAIAWWESGRASALRPGRLGGLLRLVPGVGSVFATAQAADFAELLALMVEHGVPLDDGITLAAEATGSRALRASALAIAEGLRRGDPVEAIASNSSDSSRRGMPPMLAWILATSSARGSLAPALRHAAEGYRRRAARRAEALRGALPTALVFLLGATTVIAYTALIFHPVVVLWQGLAAPGQE